MYLLLTGLNTCRDQKRKTLYGLPSSMKTLTRKLKELPTRSANKNSSSTSENRDKLLFKFLPHYAQFLLTNKLEELAAEQLRLSREVKIPLLKYFQSLTEKELLE